MSMSHEDVEGFPLLTPEEARARLPEVRPCLSRLREAFHEFQFAAQQQEELVRLSGAGVREPGHPDHEEFVTWSQKADMAQEQVRLDIRSLNALGADVKDPLLGLIDFYGRRSNGAIALLCYRQDEETITHWHDRDVGFAGRRPLSQW